MSARYLPLAGTSRRYHDLWTGETLSRRQYLRLQGIQPERLACLRRLTVVGRTQRQRWDVGVPRFPLRVMTVATPVVAARRPFSVRSYRTASGQVASVEPYGPAGYVVRIAHVPVAVMRFLPGQRQRWRCATCGQKTPHQEGMVAHMLNAHFAAACAALGVAAPR